MGIQSDEGTCYSGSSDACGEHPVHNGVEIEEENGNSETSGECDYIACDSVSEAELP